MNFKEEFVKLESENNITEEFAKKLKTYSTFKIKEIAESLCKILKYLYEKDFYLDDKGIIDFGDKDRADIYRMNLLVSKNIMERRKNGAQWVWDTMLPCDHIYLRDAEKNGNAILLGTYKRVEEAKNITFYDARKYWLDYDNKPCLNTLARIDGYLKEFVDEIIQYRFDNSLETLTKEELENYTNKFIIKKLDLRVDEALAMLNEAKRKLTIN